MDRVYLSIGSSIDRVRYVTGALDRLTAAFGELIVSSVYESEAVGFDGDPFYNLVVGLDTDQSLDTLYHALRQIEHDHDRCRRTPKFSARTLDIDILTYGDRVGPFAGGTLPRDEITRNAFVLWPLAEIAPDLRHPLLGERYGDLWARFDKRSQALWPVSFVWRGRELSGGL